MIKYDIVLHPHPYSDIGRAYTQWNPHTQKPEKIAVVAVNLYRDTQDIDEMVECIDALILCEIVCTQITEWSHRGTPHPLCVKMNTLCPIMKFLISDLKMNYSMEALENDIFLFGM